MIHKFGFFIFIFLLVSSCFAEDVEVLYLPENSNFTLNVDYIDYIISSDSVRVIKEPSSLILRNIALSKKTQVFLNVFLKNGLIKTYHLYKIPEKIYSSNFVANKNSNFFVFNRFNYDMVKQYNDVTTTYRNNLTLKFKDENKLADINFDSIKYEKVNKTKNTVTSAKLGYYNNFIQYKEFSTLSTTYNSYKISNEYQLELSNKTIIADASTSTLSNKDGLKKAKIGLNLDQFQFSSAVIEDTKTTDKEYNFDGNAYIKNNIMSGHYSIINNTMIPNTNIPFNNYYHSYTINLLHQFNFNIGQFKIQNASASMFVNEYSYSRLDGIVNPASTNKGLTLNSAYSDSYEFSNTYFKNDGILGNESFTNKGIYYNKLYDMRYSLESHYVKRLGFQDENTLSHMLYKKTNNIGYKLMYTDSPMEKTVGVGLTHDGIQWHIDSNFIYSYNNNDYKYDRIYLNLTYNSEKWNNITSLYYTNLFNSNKGNADILNNFEYQYNRNISYAIRANANWFESIKTYNGSLGFQLNYKYDKQLFDPNSRKKDLTIKVKFCLDSDYDSHCGINEIMANQSVIVNNNSFSIEKTDSNGYIYLKYSRDSDLKHISFTFENQKYNIVDQKMDSEGLVIVQDLKDVKISLIDKRNKAPLNNFIGNIVCNSVKYSKNVEVYFESNIKIPNIEEKCQLFIKIENNLANFLDKDYSFSLTNDESVFEMTPLKRKTIYFYEDLNHNNEIDLNEYIPMKINGTLYTNGYIINNYIGTEKLKLNTKMKCDFQLKTHTREYFDDIINAKCSK